MGRKEHRQRKKRFRLQKFLVGTLFLILLFGGSLHVSYADQDIVSVLTNWFDGKEADSIANIEEAIAAEQQKQTERLKEELRLEIDAANSQLNEFTKEEKAKRVKELEQHADDLLQNFQIDHTETEAEIIRELEQIMESAKEQMEEVTHVNSMENKGE